MLRLRLWAWWHGYKLKPAVKGQAKPQAPDRARHVIRGWTPARIEAAGLLFGTGNVMPWSEDLAYQLCRSLSLGPSSKLVDLSAGPAGSAARLANQAEIEPMAATFSASLADVAAKYYGTAAPRLVRPKQPEGVLQRGRALAWREALHTTSAKAQMLMAARSLLVPGCPFSFMEFVCTKPASDTAIKAWKAIEPDFVPEPIEKFTDAFRGTGLDQKNIDDVTDLYLREVPPILQASRRHLEDMGAATSRAVSEALAAEAALAQARIDALESGAVKLIQFIGVGKHVNG
ncbi:hypothetical protein CKO28_00545 [Rhodovibrio sodomensis]|uniref:Methyltransferase n=2 Tax=Rhodovibrio sodomensis TaxID=1088 RepID=A0ABS1D925_9PROT|nr:hypothetical protein [Rhodovibrio sodomensis]